jgi:hypothetical protein
MSFAEGRMRLRQLMEHLGVLDIQSMLTIQVSAQLFVNDPDFINYEEKVSENAIRDRLVETCGALSCMNTAVISGLWSGAIHEKIRSTLHHCLVFLKCKTQEEKWRIEKAYWQRTQKENKPLDILPSLAIIAESFYEGCDYGLVDNFIVSAVHRIWEKLKLYDPKKRKPVTLLSVNRNIFRKLSLQEQQWLEETHTAVQDMNRKKVMEVVLEVMIDEIGLRGCASQDYYRVDNSLIDKVVEAKNAIPLSLCCIVADCATRAGLQGVTVRGFPGHILLGLSLRDYDLHTASGSFHPSRGEPVPCFSRGNGCVNQSEANCGERVKELLKEVGGSTVYIDVYHQGMYLGLSQALRLIGIALSDDLYDVISDVLHTCAIPMSPATVSRRAFANILNALPDRIPLGGEDSFPNKKLGHLYLLVMRQQFEFEESSSNSMNMVGMLFSKAASLGQVEILKDWHHSEFASNIRQNRRFATSYELFYEEILRTALASEDKMNS